MVSSTNLCVAGYQIVCTNRMPMELCGVCICKTLAEIACGLVSGLFADYLQFTCGLLADYLQIDADYLLVVFFTTYAFAGLSAGGKYIFHPISTDLSLGRLFYHSNQPRCGWSSTAG